jgi:trimeric autotransporter adhesin
MPRFTLFSLRVALVASLFLIASMSGPVAQQRVGVHSAVNPDATGAPPGATPRRLVIGQDAVFNERITTAENGQTQVLFLDRSSMTIGPNSDLTIDQFVYDPQSGTGKLAMSATRGLLRYVGGKLSKQDEGVTLRTGAATIAIRGGAFIADINRGSTDATLIYGKGLTVTGVAGGLQILTRPGFHSITLTGGLPSPPALVPPGQLALFTQHLDGRSGGTGGASKVPTDASVVNSGVGGTISGNLTSSVQQAAATQPQTIRLTTATTPAGTTSQFNSAGQVIDCAKTTCGTSNPTQVATIPLDQLVSSQNSTTSSSPNNSITGSLLPTPIADITALKSAAFIGTYTGTASGQVFNASGLSVPASGGFTGTYNFGTQNGTLAVTNFAGQTFATSGSLPLIGTNYTTGPVVQQGVVGIISGGFFGPNAAQTSGVFAVQTASGGANVASGTYSGKR